MTLPLSGIRVIELCTVAFGPYASQILADQGADVIKVEAPEGDQTRHTGPARHTGMSASFLAVNRNKRSVVLNLKREEDREQFWALVKTADVVMVNIRKQKTEAIGIDYETLRKINPHLIYASLAGFREDGPYAGKPAYDDIIQGLSGGAALMEMQTGTHSYFPTVIADKVSGLFAAQAISAALVKHAAGKKGMHIEVPMFESMVGFFMVEHWYGGHFEEFKDQIGYPRALDKNRQPYPTKNGQICMMPYTTAHWLRFWDKIGRPELGADERFRTMEARTRHIPELYGELKKALLERTTEDWLQVCEEIDIPAAKVNDLASLEDDPHLKQVGLFQDIEHPGEGTIRTIAPGVRFDSCDAPMRPAPLLGQHTAEVLQSLAFPVKG